NKQLEGHGKQTHSDGFSSPVGRIKNFGKALEDADDGELEKLGIVPGNRTELNFIGDLSLTGRVSSILKRNSKMILISFAECTLKDEQGNVYFEPTWGVYDMAVGAEIISVYSGAADKDAFEEIVLKAKIETFHPEYTAHQKHYHDLFRQVRICRETQNDFERLREIWSELKEKFRDDWLCAMEILEILELENTLRDLAQEIRIHLEMKASNETELKKLIQNGFYLISKAHHLQGN
ncbi:MAG: phenylalanine 4-monooxygenase, partial [Sphingobacterium thalpophilum]